MTASDREWIRDERAAIMEYDGGLTRQEAERRADEEVERMHNARLDRQEEAR